MKNNVSFATIFKTALTKYQDVFDLFSASFIKVLVYFIVLNLMIVLPITMQLVNMEQPNYSRWGFTFHETVPEWLPNELPTHCVIVDQSLQCASTMVYEYDITNRDTTYRIYLNATDDTVISTDNAFVFKDTTFDAYINGYEFTFYYRGFDYLDFEELHNESPENAADILYESLFQSIKPTLILPALIFFVGVLTLTNLILLLSLSGLAMLFGFNNSHFPSYPNMVKLMIFASTIPSFINLGLGFFGLSAFTSITYNLITPLIAYLMYRKSQLKYELNNM